MIKWLLVLARQYAAEVVVNIGAPGRVVDGGEDD